MLVKIIVKIIPNDRGNPPVARLSKLADAELHFTDGPLDGLKLTGFGIWERRNSTGRNVTFPARQYSVNGERHSFALLRVSDTSPGIDDGGVVAAFNEAFDQRRLVDAYAQDRVRDLILDAYADAVD